MSSSNTIAKQILKIIEAAGKEGLTRLEISKAISGRGCDCENWINTFLEAGVIEKCGKRGRADLYRLVKHD